MHINLKKIICDPLSKKKCFIFNNEIMCGKQKYFVNKNKTFLMLNEKNYNYNEFYNLKKILTFWDSGWKLRYTEHKHLFKLKFEDLKKYIIKNTNEKNVLEDLWTSEIDKTWLKDKIGLNIGPGCGEETAGLLINGNNHVIAIDLTEKSLEYTNSLCKKIPKSNFITIQADSRFLPIKNNSCDFVFSHGVLHHSPDFKKSISEIHRVLKKNGRAFLSVYNKNSITFSKLRISGFLKGYFTKNKFQKYLNERTEQAWSSENSKNYYTETFTKKTLHQILKKKFNIIKLRRAGFVVPFVNNDLFNNYFRNSYLSKKFGTMIYASCYKI
jgi:ubiquinone/menaquinone biosynthesis C-methylase UbiE